MLLGINLRTQIVFLLVQCDLLAPSEMTVVLEPESALFTLQGSLFSLKICRFLGGELSGFDAGGDSVLLVFKPAVHLTNTRVAPAGRGIDRGHCGHDQGDD